MVMFSCGSIQADEVSFEFSTLGGGGAAL